MTALRALVLAGLVWGASGCAERMPVVSLAHRMVDSPLSAWGWPQLHGRDFYAESARYSTYGAYAGDYFAEQLVSRGFRVAAASLWVDGCLGVEEGVAWSPGGQPVNRVTIRFDLIEPESGQVRQSIWLTETAEGPVVAQPSGTGGSGNLSDNWLAQACRVLVDRLFERLYPDGRQGDITLARGRSRFDRWGRERAAAGDMAGALGLFRQAIDARPDDHAALYNAAVMCEWLGEDSRALNYYNRAKQLSDRADYHQGYERVQKKLTTDN